MKKLFAIAAAVVAVSAAAHASNIPVMTNVTASGSDFNFHYLTALAPDQGLTSGDRLVIIDFTGYVPGSVYSTNANWTASVASTLPSGLLLLPGVTDKASVADLIFTYIGPDYQVGGGPYADQTNYLGLGALSSFSKIVTGSFSAEAIKNSGFTQGSVTYNVGSVAVPGVPEASTWAMLLVGVFGIGGALRSRRRTIAATA